MNDHSPSAEYLPFNTDADLVAAVAHRWIEQVRSGCCRTVALSGGRIAERLFQTTARTSQSRRVPWSGVHCFWADERCVPPGHPQSNYRVAKDALLDPLDWPAHCIHRIQGEIQPEEAARQAEQELRAVTGSQGRLDLILLGMGEDGHVASLFPGASTRGTGMDRHYLPVQGPKPPPNRVTLSFHALQQASQVWVIVSGAGKEAPLQQALKGHPKLPLGRLISLRSSTQIFSSVLLTGT